jgi:hypothetical protein
MLFTYSDSDPDVCQAEKYLNGVAVSRTLTLAGYLAVPPQVAVISRFGIWEKPLGLAALVRVLIVSAPWD